MYYNEMRLKQSGDMMNGLSAGAERMKPSHTHWTPLSELTYDWTGNGALLAPICWTRRQSPL